MSLYKLSVKVELKISVNNTLEIFKKVHDFPVFKYRSLKSLLENQLVCVGGRAHHRKSSIDWCQCKKIPAVVPIVQIIIYYFLSNSCLVQYSILRWQSFTSINYQVWSKSLTNISDKLGNFPLKIFRNSKQHCLHNTFTCRFCTIRINSATANT